MLIMFYISQARTRGGGGGFGDPPRATTKGTLGKNEIKNELLSDYEQITMRITKATKYQYDNINIHY